MLRSHLFGSPTIISCDHELNAFVLQNEDRLFQCSYPKSIHGILGKLSMLVVVGDAHKRLRSIALGLTNTWKSKIEYLHDIDRQVITMMESWKRRERVVFCEEARKVRGMQNLFGCFHGYKSCFSLSNFPFTLYSSHSML